MADTQRQVIQLQAEDDVAGFRLHARRLLLQHVAPTEVSWQVSSAAELDLFGIAEAAQAVPEVSSPTCAPEAVVERTPPAITVPAFFVALCNRTGLHAHPSRFGLLYRLLWRLHHEPGLRKDPLDADRMQAEEMARAVRRDMHKMTAFVRFRPIALADDGAGEVQHIAWFEPQHHIVTATASFFARRFAQMQWAILTPERCVRWDGQALTFGPGARREDAPQADANERLWLTYYENIFNPARLKVRMMKKEMPVRYWKNLPEAALIQPLTARAAERSSRMVDAGGSAPARRRPVASRALIIEPHRQSEEPPRTQAALREATEHCRECPIGQFATQAVNGEGPLQAPLMLVGEQPGDQEDLRGQPFVGPAGKLLDRALQQLGWPRDTLYVTNAVRHFKYELRGKRRIHKTPTQQEAAACLHWLDSELAMVRPTAAVALGATAARSLLGRQVAVMSERGQWVVRDDGLPVLITLHPSALLRLAGGDFEAAYDAWLDDLRKATDRLPPAG